MSETADRINRGPFTSGTDEWATPESFMKVVHQRWPRFDLDVCALPVSAKADRYFTPRDDGLSLAWDGPLIWMNPPYGRTIAQWVRRAWEARIDNEVVCLLPVRSDTAWWHDYVMRAAEIGLIRGRLHFGGDHERTAHNAPFPSAIVVFREAPGLLRVSSLPRSLEEA